MLHVQSPCLSKERIKQCQPEVEIMEMERVEMLRKCFIHVNRQAREQGSRRNSVQHIQDFSHNVANNPIVKLAEEAGLSTPLPLNDWNCLELSGN